MIDEQIEKAVKSLKWVANQIPRNLGDSNGEKMLSCIKLYCENGAEAIKCIKEENKKLRKRLQISPYGDDKIDELELAVKFLQIDKEQVRKNTAKEILQELFGAREFEPLYDCDTSGYVRLKEIKELSKKYGIEVDDD